MLRKMKSVLALLLSAAMAVSVGAIRVSATTASVGLLGDVDGDGVITGHDSAMVTRYLYVDSDLLSDEQLAIADYNGDGVVDQTDADLIHVREEYALGAVGSSRYPTAQTGSYILKASAAYNLGSLSVTAHDEDFVVQAQLLSYDYNYDEDGEVMGYYLHYEHLDWTDSDFWNTPGTKEIDELLYNLLDLNGDTQLDAVDCYLALRANATVMLLGSEDILYSNGRYDLCEESLDALTCTSESYATWSDQNSDELTEIGVPQ